MLISLLSHILKVDLIEELGAVLSETHADRIVITGSNGYFAAGADIAELSRLTGPGALDYALRGQSLMNLIGSHPATVIAAIDGYCFGGGLDLALACDLRYATARSNFAHPGGRIGIMTGWGGTRRLPQIIGKNRALEMMAMGRRLNAAEAYDWGLINGICEDPAGYAFREY